MTLLLSVLPESWRPYAKTWLAVIGAIAVTLTIALPSVPSWWAVVVSVLTALGVYAQPNATLPNVVETVTPDGTRIAGPASPLPTGSVIPTT